MRRDIAELFELDPALTHLNHGAFGAGPRAVREAQDAARGRLERDPMRAFRAELPELLWLLQMGVVLYWVHDSSDGQARTRRLVRQVVPLVDKLVRLSRLPGMRGVVGDVTELVRSLRH